MKLFRITISLLLILSLLLSPVACSTQQKKIIYETEHAVYYEVEQPLAPKLIKPVITGTEVFGEVGLQLTIITFPIWAPIVTIHHYLKKPIEIDVVGKHKGQLLHNGQVLHKKRK